MVKYVKHIYHDLIQQYQTWPEIKEFLLSLGLHISDENETYCVIRSKNNVPSNDIQITKWFRSTVWNKELNRPVSIAPPKSSTSFPYQTCQEIADAGLFCQEFVDGFMINYFMTANENVVTSRSKLGGTGHFYSSRSFHDLFLEAAGTQLATLVGPDAAKDELSVSYSFLVQHKEHRVVTQINDNRILLVQKTSLKEDGVVIIEDGFETFQGVTQFHTIFIGEGDLPFNEWCNEYFATKSWEFQGIVLKDLFGNRWRFCNGAYMQVKALRGNSANHLERFAQLYVKGLIETYLHYYPLESYTFVCNNVFMNMIHQTVYNYYVQLHITKVITMDEIDAQYRRHVYSLHKYYINELRPQNKKITYNEVAYYFFRLPWQALAHLLRVSQDSYFSLMNEVVSQ